MNRVPTAVDLVFIACMVMLMAVALYTIPNQKHFSQEVSTDGR